MTRTRKTALRLAALGAFLSVFLATPALRAQEGPGCSNATMKGTYVMTGSGSITGVGALVTIAIVTYDGNGGARSTGTTSVSGTVYRSVPSTGTYKVNADCTGTKTFTGPGGTSNFDFVITPNGSEITWIVTDAGAILSGKAVRWAPAPAQ